MIFILYFFHLRTDTLSSSCISRHRLTQTHWQNYKAWPGTIITRNIPSGRSQRLFKGRETDCFLDRSKARSVLRADSDEMRCGDVGRVTGEAQPGVAWSGQWPRASMRRSGKATVTSVLGGGRSRIYREGGERLWQRL